MQTFLLAATCALVLNIVVAGVRALRGPSTRDRMTALLLLSTTGSAALVVLAQAVDVPALRTAALVLVALASLTVVVRVTGERDRA
ncbi:hypothetical protein [Cellulomonas phragmiteti]|uniref:Cation:proton antiporter n=1 Tax=Cellulomonas phragmiteti TaxID=478780 RepID=A0ABQ4DMF5_9CELL|nr:hypothetical protein [Cellulomonas phragmiteti]GIG40529.1 hypothetical protein Cph01nite_22910 [Cellulomonas phragmiteti]